MWGRGFTLFVSLSPFGWWFDMARFGRWAALALSTLLLAGAFIISTPTGPAMALGTCPPGAPPMSTLCSPAGFVVVQGAYDTAKGVAVIKSAAVTAELAAGAFAVKQIGEGVTDTFNDVLGVNQDGIDPFEVTYNPDVNPGYLETVATTAPGWDPGGFGAEYEPGWGSRVQLTQTIQADMVVTQSPTYGAGGTLTVTYRCSASKYNAITFASVYSPDGTKLPGLSGYCNKSQVGTWKERSVGINTSHGIGHVVFADGQVWRPMLSPDRNPGGEGGVAGEIYSNAWCVGVGNLTWNVTESIATSGFSFAVDGNTCNGTGPNGANGVLDAFSLSQIDTGGTTRPIFDYTAPNEVTRIPTEFPNCLDGGAECTLQLWKITQGQAEQWCGNAAVGCPDWWASDSKADHYQCRYGQYTVDLGACAVYRKPGTVSPNTGVTFLEDGTMVSGGTITSTNPDDFNDLDSAPSTGVGPLPGWEPTPGTGTGTGTTPGTGTGTGAGSQPITSDQNCIPTGWGIFNPVEWVYVPVKCALEWAFIPQTPLTIDTFKETLDTSTLGQVNLLVGGLFDQDWTGTNTCQPILRVSLDVLRMNELNVNTCHPIVEGLSPIIRTGLVVLVFVIGGGVFANAILLGFDIQAMQTIKGARGD